jgi:hypothetical protein
MPQFDAEGIVEPIKVRLLPYVEGFDWTEIPEPTDRQIGEFMKGLKALMKSALTTMGVEEGTDLADPDQMVKALDDLEPDKFVEVMQQMAELHSALCSGTPSTEQLMLVPMRRRVHFYSWLQSEVMSPEAATPAGSGQVASLAQRRGA